MKNGINHQMDKRDGSSKYHNRKRQTQNDIDARANLSFPAPNPCGPQVLTRAVVIDNTMTSRRPDKSERDLVTYINDKIGFYRTYSPRDFGHYFFNKQHGLMSMAYNLSQAAAALGGFDGIFWLPCYEKKITCDMDYKQEVFDHNAERNPNRFGTVFGFPNYCAKDFKIVGAFGVNDDEIMQSFYDNYQAIILDLKYQVIGAGCASTGGKPSWNVDSYYFCTLIFVEVINSVPLETEFDTPCLCLRSDYNCCPTGLNTAFHPNLHSF